MQTWTSQKHFQKSISHWFRAEIMALIWGSIEFAVLLKNHYYHCLFSITSIVMIFMLLIISIIICNIFPLFECISSGFLVQQQLKVCGKNRVSSSNLPVWVLMLHVCVCHSIQRFIEVKAIECSSIFDLILMRGGLTANLFVIEAIFQYYRRMWASSRIDGEPYWYFRLPIVIDLNTYHWQTE